MATHYLLTLLFFLLPNLSRGDSPLKFEYRDTPAHWDFLGPSVSAGNGLYVAYNGSHTHVMDVNMLQEGTNVQGNGYTAWRLIETNSDGPSVRSGYAMSSLGNGKVLMYGGWDGKSGGQLKDAWIFTLSFTETNGKDTGTWTKTEDGPSARSERVMSSLGNGKVLMYGGEDSNGGLLNDAWIFTLSSNEKNEEETGTWTLIQTKDGPSARRDHAMASFGNGKVLMYGGTNNNLGYLQDAWIFTLSLNEKNGKETGTWTRTADGPSARENHAMSSLGNGKVLMYGGNNGNSDLFNDAWIFTLSSNEKNGKETGTWTQTQITTDGPSARYSHAMASLGNGKVLMYGGRDGNSGYHSGYLNDAWIFTLSSNEMNGKETGIWTKTEDGPSARYGHAMSSLGNGKVLMYGGSYGNGYDLNDAWIFTLSINEMNGKETGAWTRTADGPSARYYHAMSSLGNGKVLMYGGVGNGYLQDFH
jgi:hypothetical protein